VSYFTEGSDFDIPEEVLTEVLRLHAEVSRDAAILATRLGSLLVCRLGCDACCQDDLAVFPIEAEIIRRHCEPLLKFDQPHPPGKCAFLDAGGACRIYPWRPYVCRTQGLPLRWMENGEVEERGICSLNAEQLASQSIQLEALPVDDCWTIGQFENRLAGLQVRALGTFQETLPRVKLRDLFTSGLELS